MFSEKFSVNELITVTLLPIHFWNEVEANESTLANPGKQLQSWIVAFALQDEEVTLPAEIKAVYDECADFSVHIKAIIDWMEHKLLYLYEVATSHDGNVDLIAPIREAQRYVGKISNVGMVDLMGDTFQFVSHEDGGNLYSDLSTVRAELITHKRSIDMIIEETSKAPVDAA
jgi:hypothetical protein